MDLLEASLAFLHVVCGLQKLNAGFFAGAPLFFGPALHDRTLGLLPVEPTGTMISYVAPLMELGGGLLVVIGAFAHRSTRHSLTLRLCSALGNLTFLGYHCGITLVLYGSEEAGIECYNFVCVAITIEALLGARREIDQCRTRICGRRRDSMPPSSPSTALANPPKITAHFNALARMARDGRRPTRCTGCFAPLLTWRRVLVFAIGLCIAGLPLANAIFDDTWWGWIQSGSLHLYAWREPQINVCAADGAMWPERFQHMLVPMLACIDDRSGHAAGRHLRLLANPCESRCLPIDLWGMQSLGQRHMDVGFAMEAGRLWGARFGATNVTVEGHLHPRFTLSTTNFAVQCGDGANDSCADSRYRHAGGVAVGLVIASVLTLAWPSLAVRSTGNAPDGLHAALPTREEVAELDTRD